MMERALVLSSRHHHPLEHHKDMEQLVEWTARQLKKKELHGFHRCCPVSDALVKDRETHGSLN
jgi:hypothetical protein